MDGWICRNCFLSCLILIVSEFQIIESSRLGHYRCSWHFGSPPPTSRSDITTSTYGTNQPACSSVDNSRITEYVNNCSSQNYVPLLACREDGTWNCQSFIAMCKTLIHTDTILPNNKHGPASSPETHKQDSGPSLPDLQKGTEPSADADAKMFNPDENYFTMKEMAIAVLVSFITGATMLAIVICVVWRCRHSHLSSEQAMEAAHQSAKRLAALHAITHIAHAIGGGQETLQSCHFANPQYGQIIASRDILGDALMEHDRVYEEIFTRRKSSCKGQECIYANVDKTKKKTPTMRKNRSSGDLRTIDESAEESDFGYEADNNATPQVPRRKINNWGNMINNNKRSPALNARRLNDNAVNDDLLWKSYMNDVSNNSGKEQVGPANSQAGVNAEDEISKDEVSKCDSGYIEEISETGHETVKVGDDKGADIKDWDDTGAGKRKQSLRL
ncbi:uncharacterized protein LOC123529460 [Mercenaria mercenaria]|uniref:uncharacterized protein LOC123529460 n=1 Tax=Mercenaria mercenaria TaxID=6596 RepID=UPI00234F695F|nr:uncharacterized protein LOC123529460 [Mercenaria mercenaria]